MKKQLIFAVLAGVMLAGCADSEDIVANEVGNESSATQVPVAFGTYMARGAVSRAVEMTEATKGSIATDAQLKASTGFGVFGYYTGRDKYPTDATAGTPTFKPNFMYNERVLWTTDATTSVPAAADATGAKWDYWPQKYWPNDFSDSNVDNQTVNGAATGSESYGGYVSFFAYAPYTGQDDDSSDDQKDADGTLTTDNSRVGITAISGKGASGNPTVTYKLATNGNNVDLLWGTATQKYNSAAKVDNKWYHYGATVKYTGGVEGLFPVNVNLTKPWVKDGATTIDEVKFNFKHALAKVGGSLQADESESETASHGLQVKLDIDKDNNITGGTKPDQTKVTIKQIVIENNGSMDMDGSETVEDNEKVVSGGTLDLATGRWTPSSEHTAIKHTINTAATIADDAVTDKDNAEIAESLAEPAASELQTSGKQDWTKLPNGVLTYAQNVYKTETAPLVFIPGTKPAFKVTVEYVVRTRDTKLENGYSEVTQKISKYVQFTSNVELNKRYNLVMHLGLTSVKFTATVDKWTPDWTDTNNNGQQDPGETETNEEVYLPINVKSTKP